MNLFRLVRTAGILSLLAGSLTSCLNEPDYPDTPSISFESIRLQRYPRTNALPIDSVFITINFEDGDGDLGATSAEAASLRYGANYVNTAFVRNTITSQFDSARRVYTYLPKTDLYSRFEHLSATTDSRAAPLKGTLTRAYGFNLGSPYQPNDEVRFRISIFDRALHQSNEVETSSITILPR